MTRAGEKLIAAAKQARAQALADALRREIAEQEQRAYQPADAE